MSDRKTAENTPDLANQNAFDFIEQSINRSTFLGSGSEFVVFALKGFGDEELDHRYALRIDKSYVPRNHITYKPYSQTAYKPPRHFNDLLTSSTALTPPEQLYTGSSISQYVLSNAKDDYKRPTFSIVTRQHGQSIDEIINDEISANSTSLDAALNASRSVATKMFERLESNPEKLASLFKQTAELGWHGIRLRDMHIKNILIDDDDNLSMVDVYNGALSDRLRTPYNFLLAEQNVEVLARYMISDLETFYGPDLPIDIESRMKTLFENAIREGLGEAGISDEAKGHKSDAHSSGFKHIDSSNAIRIDKNSSAKDLLSALNALHGEINTGRGA